MSKTKTARQVILRYEGRIELRAPADRSKVEQAAAKFFDQASHYCASLGVALPGRIELNFPDGSHLIVSRPKLKTPALTEQQLEIVHELLMPIFLEFCESIACTEADHEIKKMKQQYEKAVFGKFRNNKGKRAGAGFLRGLQLAELYHRENPSQGSQAIALIRTVYGSPLFGALIGNDTEFVQGILEQMGHSLSERQKLKKRLIEIDELRHPTGPELTWKEIWRKYCPKHIDTPENFQKLLKECGIPFGKAGEWRGKQS
jgi:hypothetical protein